MQLFKRFLSYFSLKNEQLAPLVILYLLAHIFIWTFFNSLTHISPIKDNMEELVWASSLELGYYKHPPVPSWLMYFFTLIFGRSVWLTFFAGELCVAFALWFVWKLGCLITSQKNAFIAILLVSLISYFSVRGLEYNHNTVQLWSIAGATWYLYLATRREKLTDWIILGVFCAFAFLTKYSALIQFATFALYLLFSGRLKYASTWKGIAVATLSLVLLVSPHLIWLLTHGGGPLAHAGGEMEPVATYWEELKEIAYFTTNNIARISPMILGLIIVIFAYRKNNLKRNYQVLDQQEASYTLAEGINKSDRFFLFFVGLAPFVLTILVAGIAKIPFHATHWATTFFILFGFYGLWFLKGKEAVLTKYTLITVLILHVVTALLFSLARGPIASAINHPNRANFPGPTLATILNYEWGKHMDEPLRLVAGHTWIAGSVAINSHPNTEVFIDAIHERSPWLNPEITEHCSLMVLIDNSKKSKDSTAPETEALMEKADLTGQVEIPWTYHKNGAKVTVDWGIIKGDSECKW